MDMLRLEDNVQSRAKDRRSHIFKRRKKGLHSVGSVCRDSEDRWKIRWSKLWHNPVPLKMEIFTWRMLHRGFLTATRASRMEIFSDLCNQCGCEPETLEHLFWNCNKLGKRKNLLLYVRAMSTGNSFESSFLQVIDGALCVEQDRAARLWILYTWMRSV